MRQPMNVQVDERGNPRHPQWGAGHCEWEIGDSIEVQNFSCVKRHVFMGDAGGGEEGGPQLMMEALVVY